MDGGDPVRLTQAAVRERHATIPVVASCEASAFQPVAGGDGTVAHLRARFVPQTVFGDVGWSQTLWLCGEDGGHVRQLVEVGARVSRMAPGGCRDGWLASRMLDGIREELVLVRRDGSVRVLHEDREDLMISAYDWGAGENEILVVPWNDGRESRPHTLSRFDPEQGRLEAVVDLDPPLAAEGVPEPMIWSMAVSREGERVALVIGGPGPARSLWTLDLKSRALRRIHDFETTEAPSTPSWTPGGQRLAFSASRQSQDIFVLDDIGL